MDETSAVGNTGDHQNHCYKFFHIKHLQMSIWVVHHPMDHPELLVEALMDMLLEMFSILLMQVMMMLQFQELEINVC
jgi:hypothetical protein